LSTGFNFPHRALIDYRDLPRDIKSQPTADAFAKLRSIERDERPRRLRSYEMKSGDSTLSVSSGAAIDK
jgi:hypothetical protein